MRLTELAAEFAIAGENDPRKVGVIFDCPCGCGVRRWIPFSNPVGGGSSITQQAGGGWKRSGATLEDLTLRPSIHIRKVEGSSGCGWHGFITDGDAKSV